MVIFKKRESSFEASHNFPCIYFNGFAGIRHDEMKIGPFYMEATLRNRAAQRKSRFERGG